MNNNIQISGANAHKEITMSGTISILGFGAALALIWQSFFYSFTDLTISEQTRRNPDRPHLCDLNGDGFDDFVNLSRNSQLINYTYWSPSVDQFDGEQAGLSWTDLSPTDDLVATACQDTDQNGFAEIISVSLTRNNGLWTFMYEYDPYWGTINQVVARQVILPLAGTALARLHLNSSFISNSNGLFMLHAWIIGGLPPLGRAFEQGVVHIQKRNDAIYNGHLGGITHDSLIADDINGDGLIDLAAIRVDGSRRATLDTMIMQTISSQFVTGPSIDLGTADQDQVRIYMTGGDFTGDQKFDIALQNQRELRLFVNTSDAGQISFRRSQSLHVEGENIFRALPKIIGDYDRDGLIDIAWVQDLNEGGRMVLLSGDGRGQFELTDYGQEFQNFSNILDINFADVIHFNKRHHWLWLQAMPIIGTAHGVGLFRMEEMGQGES